ncbi:hypothetical protein JW752_01120 [Candidatus Peregrinibacteria bacterium]|nr:hypothetical protein [Candidatus Peregrinibacteria bacterium]
MFTNLLIASALVLTTLIVILNFNRLLEWSDWMLHRFSQFRSFIDIMAQAYRNRHQLNS